MSEQKKERLIERKGGEKRRGTDSERLYVVQQQNRHTPLSLKQTPCSHAIYLSVCFFTENSPSVSAFDLLTWKTIGCIDIHVHTPS